MAGFISPLFVLGISAQASADAGFRSPLYLQGISAQGSGGADAGFRSPLYLQGISARQRAGYPTPLPLLFGYAGTAIIEPETPGTTSGIPTFIDYYEPDKKSKDDDILWLTPHGV